MLAPGSVRNKASKIKDYIVDNGLDIMALTETWITNIKINCELIYDLVPHGFPSTINLGKRSVREVVVLVSYAEIQFLITYPGFILLIL